MRIVRLYAMRTFGALIGSLTASLAAFLFLSVSAFLFARALAQAEGLAAAIPVLWSAAAVWTLPALAAIVTMRLISDDRLSGRLDLVLVAPILERSYVLGRFWGAFAYVALVLMAYWAVPLCVLPCFSSSVALACSMQNFMPAYLGLLFQAALWCAIGVLASAAFRQAAVAAAASFSLTALLPQALYAAAFAWSPLLRARLPVFPVEANLTDAAMGVFRFSSLVGCAFFTTAALFLAVKAVSATRFIGRGARVLRLSTACACLLCLVFSVLAVVSARRLDFHVEWPLPARAQRFSPRTLGILSEVTGDVRVTCFLSRGNVNWKGVSHILESVKVAVVSSGGRLVVDYADPRWDVSVASRLVRTGVKEGSVVFEREREHRRIVVPAAEVDENICASALQRLSLPVGREAIYWTTGHGEHAFDTYDDLAGMSTLARSLRRDGYVLKPLDLSNATSVPEDCGVLVVAGPRTAFSASETALLDGYLRREGRLLALIAPKAEEGVGINRLLAEWGVSTLPFTAVSPRTRDGADLVAADYGDHAITRLLTGTAVVFHEAVPLMPTAAVTGGVEKIVFTPLVKSDAGAWGESDTTRHPWTFDAVSEPQGPFNLAVAVERGGARGQDLALKPTRIVVVGDASFAVDGALTTRANANADFMRNSLAWLAGLDAMTASGTPVNVLNTRMDRLARKRFVPCAAVCLPLLLLLPGLLLAWRRRLG